MLEAALALSTMSLVLTGAIMLSVSGGRSFDRSSAQLDADRQASSSVQRMMQDLEEAKQVTVLFDLLPARLLSAGRRGWHLHPLGARQCQHHRLLPRELGRHRQ